MSEKSAPAYAMTHFRRLSWRTRLAENRPVVAFFLAALIVGMLAGAIVPLMLKLAFCGYMAYFPLCLLAGVATSLGAVFAVRYADRKIFGAMKSGILAVEERIIKGETKTQMADLEKMVAGYLKLKRLAAADFYSRKLLELSKSGGSELMRLSDWMVTTECWVSTDKYHKSWNYFLFWLFETRGVLTLSPNKLDFQSKKLSFSCTPAHIVSIELKRHPLWLKPIPFRYISIVIDEDGIRHTFNLTPSFGQTDTVFDCNRLVELWYQRLSKVRCGRSPAATIPDWLNDVAS